MSTWITELREAVYTGVPGDLSLDPAVPLKTHVALDRSPSWLYFERWGNVRIPSIGLFKGLNELSL